MFKPTFWPGIDGPYVYLVSFERTQRTKSGKGYIRMQDISGWFNSAGLVERGKIALGVPVSKSFRTSLDLIKETRDHKDNLFISAKQGLPKHYVNTQLRLCPPEMLDEYLDMCKKHTVQELFGVDKMRFGASDDLLDAASMVYSKALFERAQGHSFFRQFTK